MMLKRWIFATPMLSVLLAVTLPMQETAAQTCAPLQVIGGAGTQAQKRVSLPGTLTSRSNWNTDFAVPGNHLYQRYIATIEPLNRSRYQVQMFLKYSNGTADKVYDQTVNLPARQAFTIYGSSRIDTFPYQVNVSIGGLSALGNTYRVSVLGCY